MFQKEVAERIVARPGGKSYGRLALLELVHHVVRVRRQEVGRHEPGHGFHQLDRLDAGLAVEGRLGAARLEQLPAETDVDVDEFGTTNLDIKAQTKAVLDNINDILKEEGASLKDIVDVVSLGFLGPVTTFLTAIVVWPWMQKQRKRNKSKTLFWFIITFIVGLIPIANILPDLSFFVWRQYSKK